MNLKRKFDAGEFAVLAEMEPPKGVDVSTMLSNAMRVKGEVDAFVIPEMSNAVMRMSSLGGAMILQGLTEYLRVFEEWRLAIFGALVLFTLRYTPEGILPKIYELANVLWRRSLDTMKSESN